MLDNVRCEQALRERLESGNITILDDVVLSLGDALASLFPGTPVYLSPARQRVGTPAWFLRLYEVVNTRFLHGESVYDFGFDLAYFPAGRESDFELNNALHKAVQMDSTFPGTSGTFTIERKYGTVTDRVAHITGVIRAHELNISDDPMIQIAEKEVKI